MCFIINVPVKREVFAASFRDRVVHHLIYNCISPVLERKFIYDCFSCRSCKGTRAGIERLEHHIRSCSDNFTRPAYALKLDISGYFMNIDRELLYSQTMKMLSGEYYPHKEVINKLLRQAIYNNPLRGCYRKGQISDWDELPHSKSMFYSSPGCGLPIGNLTSQLFSNIYLTPLDYYVKRVLGFRHYGRYVDDFYIVHQSKDLLKKSIAPIRAYLINNLHLSLHPDKIYLQDVCNGIPYLGSYIKPFRRYISFRTAKSFVSRFSVIPDSKSGAGIRSVLNSYLGHLSHFATYRFRRKFVLNHPWLFVFGYFPTNYRKIKVRKTNSSENIF